MRQAYYHFYDRVFSGLMLIICLVLVAGCSKQNAFPEEMAGKWVTDAPLYEDRYIQISRTQLIFGTGEPIPNIFFVRNFQSRAKGSKIEWVFNCEIERGEEFELVFLYSPVPEETLQLKNMPGIFWYKIED